MTGELGQSVTAEGAYTKHCPTNSVNKWPTKFQTFFGRLRVTDSSMYAGFSYALGMTALTYPASLWFDCEAQLIPVQPQQSSWTNSCMSVWDCYQLATNHVSYVLAVNDFYKCLLVLCLHTLCKHTDDCFMSVLLGVKEVTPGVQSWPESDFTRYVTHTTFLTCTDNLLHAEMVPLLKSYHIL